VRHAAASRIVTVAGRDVLLVKRFDRQTSSAGSAVHRAGASDQQARPDTATRTLALDETEALPGGGAMAEHAAPEVERRSC
jgi:hypothetical protein